MSAILVRIAVGVLLMLAACAIAFRIGSRSHKQAAVLISVCWASAALMQLHAHLKVEPLIGGDIVYGVGLLWLVWRHNERWLWLAIAVQTVFFFLHASLYERGATPTSGYIIANNILCTLTLAVLVGGSVQAALKRRAAAASEIAPAPAL